MIIESPVLTVSELADFLQIHRTTIYRMIKRGMLPAFKIGADYRFNRESILQWTVEQQVAPANSEEQS